MLKFSDIERNKFKCHFVEYKEGTWYINGNAANFTPERERQIIAAIQTEIDGWIENMQDAAAGKFPRFLSFMIQDTDKGIVILQDIYNMVF
jgi:hypothetical protein